MYNYDNKKRYLRRLIMYTMNLSSLESPDPRYGQDDEYSYDFADDNEYDEVSISNDQIMLENTSEA